MAGPAPAGRERAESLAEPEPEPTVGSDAEVAGGAAGLAGGDAAEPEAEPEPAGAAAGGGQRRPESAAEATDGDGEQAEPGLGGVVTVVPGIARYHRSECILIRFLGADDLETMTRAAAEDAAFAPCRACQPDKPPAHS